MICANGSGVNGGSKFGWTSVGRFEAQAAIILSLTTSSFGTLPLDISGWLVG
jgi:hypothetical protein